MTVSHSHFYDNAMRYDAVLVTVLAKPQAQHLRARVLKIYSARKGISLLQLGKEIAFVHASPVYGNSALQVGETGIVFVGTCAGRLYEAPWAGHLVVEGVDGEPHAIFPHMTACGEHDDLFLASRQDPQRAYARAIGLEVVEQYISNLIAAIDKP